MLVEKRKKEKNEGMKGKRGKISHSHSLKMSFYARVD